MQKAWSIIILLMMVFCSCSFNSKTKGQPVIDTNIAQTKKLIGIWSMCATISDGDEIRRNVCPQIEFKNNFTATIFIGPHPKTILKWRLENDSLHISTNQLISDTITKVAFKKEKKYTELRLTNKSQRKIYILGR